MNRRAFLSVAAVSWLAVCTPSFAKRRPAPTTAPPLPANQAAERKLGVFVPWSSTWLADLDAFAARVGRVPAVTHWFRDMQWPMLDVPRMNNVAARGSVPMITVEPWDSRSATDPKYTLANIIRGDFDAWFQAGATAAKTFPGRFYLRFAHEMNGHWAPWEYGVNGNTSADYVAAWRHVRGIFDQAGVTNADWVWCPNVIGPGIPDPTGFYPGSDVVEVLGMDGYNWGSLDVWQTWSQVFGPTYDIVAALDPDKPMMVAETGSAEAGGSKASWITAAYTSEIAAHTPRVTAVVWFNKNQQTDWRVESSASSLAAYKQVATSGAYG